MSWQHIRGHEALVSEFAHAFRRGRLAHAYLFTGPAGVGKRLFAVELAKTLLCERAATSDPWQACDGCASCKLVAAGNHPDLAIAGRPEDANELPIQVVRDLCQTLALKSAFGRGKVAILDDADDLNEAAANSFLKTLEEPPPQSHLILVGTSAQAQLPTILSRCQLIAFRPLPDAVVRDLLRAQDVAEGTLLERVVKLANGSPGQALALADPELWDFRGALIQAIARPPLDSVALSQQWMQFIEKAGKESVNQRRRASLTLQLLLDFLHDTLRVGVGAGPRSAEADELPLLRELAGRGDPDGMLDVIERVLEAEVQVNRYVQLVLAIEALCDALGRGLQTGTAR
ncbi:MAG: DNA polymerase III subunit delta' [Planctomycetia bacterium]|nr:DNA polymerase III subunit delta' [Planctomycetia bacterium]